VTQEDLRDSAVPRQGIVGAFSRQPTALDPATRTPLASRPRRWRFPVAATLSIVGGLALWQLVCAIHLVDPLFLPSLTSTLQRLQKDFAQGGLWGDIGASAVPFAVGVALSVVIGCVFGVLMGLSRIADKVFTPWVLAFNAIPRIAFVPMFLVLFGLGFSKNVAVVTMSASFPMILNMRSAVKNVDTELIEMTRSFHASRLLTLRRLIFPSTLPFFVAGFRIAIALGLIGEVVAEFFSSNAGVGYRLNIASQTYDITEVYSMIIVLAVFGIGLAQLGHFLERRIDRWFGQQ
jgi:NitT/TauT family transport system permease protein